MTAADGAVYGLVGALAAFPRRIAERAVEAAGGRLQRGTTRQTTHVVFGRRLIARAGAAAIMARIAAERDAGRVLLSENGFLRRLGVLAPAAAAGQGRGALVERGLGEADLEALTLFDAFESEGEPYTFRDLILAKKYAGLIAGGAGWHAIVRSVHRSGPAVSLTAKSLQVGDGAIRARDGDRLCELDGQLLFDLGAGDDPDEVFAAAEAEEAAGRAEAAAALYGRCLALDPGDAVAAFNRANCLRAAGRAAEAVADYARALRADPGFVEAWFNLACLEAARGRPAAARRHLEAALAGDPDYADAVYNLATLEFEAGHLAAAGRWWARYLELDRDSEWARTAERGLRYLAMRAPGQAG